MATPDEVVQTLTNLVTDLETDLDRAERRVVAALQSRDAVKEKIAAARATIEMVCERYELGVPEVADLDDAVRERWAKLKAKQLVVEYAQMFDGRVVINDAAQILARAGLFKDAPNAASNLYSGISRTGDLFRKIKPGVYEMASRPFAAEGPESVEEMAHNECGEIVTRHLFRDAPLVSQNGYRLQPEAV